MQWPVLRSIESIAWGGKTYLYYFWSLHDAKPVTPPPGTKSWRRHWWLPNGKLLLLSLTRCHCVPCSLPSRITTKVLKNCETFSSNRDQDQDQMFKTKTETSWSKAKTKTFIFVLQARRDQDPAHEDYITAKRTNAVIIQQCSFCKNR